MVTYQVAEQHRQHHLNFEPGVRPGELNLFCQDCKMVLETYRRIVPSDRPFIGPFPKSATKGGKPGK